MNKTKVHIIAHSHWDREWYMPYEAHHMRLIELLDDVLEIFETDPEFHSFHLDGQTIPLDDYLEVRPDQHDILKKYVESGKLKIGPFYILQDAFLTSSESNVRNALIGFAESKKWGAPVQLGYYPDTFGMPGQTPQLMKQIGLNVATYGRGVKPLGVKSRANVQGMQGSVTSGDSTEVDERYSSPYSEMYWRGVDGTEILGVLFANWYSNGNEIPVDEEMAKKFWDKKLADASQFASTRHLLMMNGCDHQPLQKDSTAAIHTARKLYPEIEFVHTDFDTYLAELRAELPKDLTTVEGELKSQETEGWYTLANCASSRIYLKQWNTRISRQLENITEPLATMAYDTKETYPHDKLRYAWKKYMQNHPHDSICGCSVDDVHAGMVMRFKDAYEVGKYIADEAANKLVSKIDTSCFPENSIPFVIFNTAGSAKTGSVEVEIETKRIPFTQTPPPEGYKTLIEEPITNFKVIDVTGNEVAMDVIKQEVKFGYDLPKDKFRQPYIGKFVTVKLALKDFPMMSWETFALIESAEEKSVVHSTDTRILENEYLKVTVNENGTIAVLNKETGFIYDDLLVFENVGDVGNEYIFKQPEDTQAILSTDFETTVSAVMKTATASILTLTTTLRIPISAESSLSQEQMAVIEFRQRRSKRHQTLAPLMMQTTVVLEVGSRQLKFKTTFDNQMKDHRLRVLFPTDIKSDFHVADSIFETVIRPNDVSASWKNPTNPQHQHAFVGIYDDKQGVTVSNYGLNEYELLKDRGTIAVTIHRGTGEMGDWGYFKTSESQCLGEQMVEYAIAFHGADEASRLRTYRNAQSYQIPFNAYQTDLHDGELASKHQYITSTGDAFLLTALKRKEGSHELITRGYNLTTEVQAFNLKIDGLTAKECNLLEEEMETEVKGELRPAEIVSYIWD